MLQSRVVRSLLLMGSCLVVLGSECDPELLQFVCANDPGNPQCRDDKIVFVTSTRHAGDFGGLAAGDAICNDLAANSSIASVAAGTYVAWLSTLTMDAGLRIADPGGGFIRTDGRLIATSRTDLLDGSLDRPIELDENGSVPSVPFVWTGTAFTGSRDADTCASWTTSAPNVVGEAGSRGETDDDWTEAVQDNCAMEWHLYCFEI